MENGENLQSDLRRTRKYRVRLATRSGHSSVCRFRQSIFDREAVRASEVGEMAAEFGSHGGAFKRQTGRA